MLAAVLTCACGPKAADEGDGDDGGADDGAPGDDGNGDTGDDPTGGMGSDDGDGTGDGDTGDDGPPASENAIDLLFVMDNSGSMGEEQGVFSTAVEALVADLDATGADYRIAFTTTDNGNPWCSGTTPEGGALRLTTCTSRRDEFIFTGTDPPTDQYDTGCADQCAYDDIAVTPTEVDGDPNPAPRRWLEKRAGTTNLPADVSMVDAIRCFAPQGINGCGFESPLESLYKTLARSADANDASYGFVREGSVLGVVVVTDEVDCSYADESIFLPDGDRTFWPNPMDAYPTSAVCWNAGVACTGGPGTYDDCVPTNKDIAGNVDVPDSEAALRPLTRYVENLRGRGQPVVAAAIAGVPEGYAGGAELIFADSDDDEYQKQYGIGPGCESANGRAVPPVRIRGVVESLSADPRRLYSICAADYAGAFGSIVAALADKLPP